MQVNLLYVGIDKVHFQDILVFDRRRGGVESPGMKSMDDSNENQHHRLSEGRTIPSFAFRWEAPAQSSESLVGHTCLASVP